MHAHGSFELTVDNHTVIIKVFGAWNYETVLQFGAEYEKQVNNLKSDAWACLLDLRGWELVTPDVWEYADKLSELSNNSKLKYYAIICSTNVQHILIARHEESLTNVDTRFFDEVEPARAWLTSSGML